MLTLTGRVFLVSLPSLALRFQSRSRHFARGIRGSSPNGHSRPLSPPLQNPVLLNFHTNSVFLHSRKRPAPVMDTFFASCVRLQELPPYSVTILAYKGRPRSILWKGRNLPSWSIRKGREICHFGERKGSKRITDAFYGCQNVENRKRSGSGSCSVFGFIDLLIYLFIFV